MNISATSPKDEIVSAALELTDSQAEQLDQLKQQQQLLWVLIAVLSALVFL